MIAPCWFLPVAVTCRSAMSTRFLLTVQACDGGACRRGEPARGRSVVCRRKCRHIARAVEGPPGRHGVARALGVLREAPGHGLAGVRRHRVAFGDWGGGRRGADNLPDAALRGLLPGASGRAKRGSAPDGGHEMDLLWSPGQQERRVRRRLRTLGHQAVASGSQCDRIHLRSRRSPGRPC